MVRTGAVVFALATLLSPPSAGAQPADPDATLAPFWLERPAYPQIAQSARVQGVVVLHLTVGADGRVTEVNVVRSIPLLAAAAVEAARASRFICRACDEDGRAGYSLTYDFRLDSDAPSARIGEREATLTVPAPVPQAIFCLSQYRVRAAKCLYLWECGTGGGGCYSTTPIPSRALRRR